MTSDELQAKFEELNARHAQQQMSDVEELKATHQTALQITDDPTTLRTIIYEMITALRGEGGRPTSRERSLAVTKLQEAMFWLMEDMARS